MNKTEVAKLLTVASGFDRRQVDTITVEAWYLVPEIAAADYTEALQAVVDHQTGPYSGEYLQVHHVVDRLRQAAGRTAWTGHDVRVAKVLHMISADWPEQEPLPELAVKRLTAYRVAQAAERARIEQAGQPQPGAGQPVSMQLKTPEDVR